MLLGRDDIAELVQTQERRLGIVLDQGVRVFGLGQFRGEVEEAEEEGLVALEDGLMAEGGREMGLPDSGRTDQDQVGRLLQELRPDVLHDLVAGDLGVERPVEVVEELGAADAGHFQEILDPAALPGSVFFPEEAIEQRPFRFGKGLDTLEQPELFPEFG